MTFRKFPLFVAIAGVMLATSGCVPPCYDDYCGYDHPYDGYYYGHHNDYQNHYGYRHDYYRGGYHHPHRDGCYDYCR